MNVRKVIIGCVVGGSVICIIGTAISVRNTREQDKYDKTWRELASFSSAFREHGFGIDYPPTSLESAVEALRNDPRLREWMRVNCAGMQTGRDYWGNKLVYQVDHGAAKVILRSIGPNGRDELGEGDDIEVECLLFQ